MVLYRDKYILDGLDVIPPDMMRDLDLAYDVCVRLRDRSSCQMCGKCCHQPFITVRDTEVERIAEYIHTDPLSFVTDYLYREDDRWLFTKTDPCEFLGPDNKCKIWGGRPEICGDFPFLVSMFMSRVYLAIVNDDYEIDIGYMDDTWPCTVVIKNDVGPMIIEARRKRKLISVSN